MTLIPLTAYAATEEEEVKVADINLKKAFRELCGVADGDPLYPSQLEALTGTIDLSDKDVEDAGGIKYLVNATAIDLSHNKITSVSNDFRLLTSLKVLDLSFNDMRNSVDVNLKDVVNLHTLDLSGNKFNYVPNIFIKLDSLRNLDISANRMESFPADLVMTKLTNLNCNYNFIDVSEGSKSRELMEKMDETADVRGAKQLVTFNDITYKTEGGNVVAMWQPQSDIEFFDGTKARLVGYSVLVDGKQRSTATFDDDYAVVTNFGGEKHDLFVSPIFNVDGYGDLRMRNYVVLEGASYGSEGPEIVLEKGDAPAIQDNFLNEPAGSASGAAADESSAQAEEVIEPEALEVEDVVEAEAAEEVVETVADVAEVDEMDDAKSPLSTMTIVLIAVVAILLVLIIALLLTVLKNKKTKLEE